MSSFHEIVAGMGGERRVMVPSGFCVREKAEKFSMPTNRLKALRVTFGKCLQPHNKTAANSGSVQGARNLMVGFMQNYQWPKRSVGSGVFSG